MKKRIANIIMVVIILAVAAAGAVYAGTVRGWFDKSENSAVLTEIRGIVNITREGVSYPVNEDTVLRGDDRILCMSGATAKIKLNDLSFLVIGEKAEVEITDPNTSSFNIEILTGEAFYVSKSEDAPITLSFDGKTEKLTDAIALLSVRSGAQSISVFSGKVKDTEAGNIINWIGGEVSVKNLPLKSLNSFAVSSLRAVNKSYETCFTDKQLDKLEQDRLAEKLTQQETLNKENETENKPDKTDEPEENSTVSGPDASDTKPENDKPEEKDPVNTEENKPSGDSPTETEQNKPEDSKPADSEPTVPEEPEVPQQPETPETPEEPEEQQPSCTISIVCDTILNNWDDLDPAKGGYVPSNGVILPTVSISFTDGETVFDVLKRACSNYGIQLEYSWTPLYGSYYVEGINNLYEFDCGFESGWMYKVNGWFPNYGCSSYTLKDGDTIVWCYTCKGLGADVGGGF